MKTLPFLIVLIFPFLCFAQITINYSDGEDRTTVIDTSAPNDPTTLEISSGSATQSGIVSGDGGVIKTGSGTVTFSGANTYTGTTTISEGQLSLVAGAESALSNSAVTIESGATLFLDDDGSGDYRLGSLSGSGSFDLNDNATTIGSDNTSTTFSGSLSGGGSFDIAEKVGSGTLTLTGSGHSLFEFDVRGSGGVIFDGAAGSFSEFEVGGSAQLTIQSADSSLNIRQFINNSTTLITGSSAVVDIDDVGNNEDLRVESGASLTVSDIFSQNSGGTTTVDEATLVIKEFNSGSVSQRGTIAISDASGSIALTLGSSASSTFQGTIEDHTSGSGSVLKTGSGTVTLSGASTYSGTTTISEGQLSLSAGAESALSNSAVTIESGATLFLDDDGSGDYRLGSLSGSGSFDLNDNATTIGSDNTSTTFSGSLSGGGSFDIAEKVGSGTLTLTGSGHSLFEFDVRGSGGVIFDGAAGSFSEFEVGGSAQLTIQNADSDLNIRQFTNNSTTLITGSSAVVDIDDVGNNEDLRVESGASLTVSDIFSQNSGGTTTVDEATLVIKEFNSASVSQRGTIAISDGSGGTALTVGSSADSTFQGTIEDHTSGSGSVLKNGSGTVTLAGTNSFTGNTTLEDGTLQTDNLAGSLVQTGGVFSPGQSPATTTIGGDYTMDENSTLLIEIGGLTQGTEYDFVDVAGTVTLSGELEISLIDSWTPSEGETYLIVGSAIGINGDFDTLTLPTLSDGLGWNLSNSGLSLSLEVIPEVSSYGLVVGFLAMSSVFVRRRRG